MGFTLLNPAVPSCSKACYLDCPLLVCGIRPAVYQSIALVVLAVVMTMMMCAGIKGIWNLRKASSDAYDSYLVLAFVGETRILEINADDELDEAEIEGFDAEQQVALPRLHTWICRAGLVCCAQHTSAGIRREHDHAPVVLQGSAVCFCAHPFRQAAMHNPV